MSKVSSEEFNNLKNKGYSFPICLEFKAEKLNPIDLFYNLEGKYKFILENREFRLKNTRYSYMGVDPYKAIVLENHKVNIIEDLSDERKQSEVKEDIFNVLKEHLNIKYLDLGEEIPFTGGAIGYMSYDFIKEIEHIEDKNKKDIGIPESILLFYKTIVIYDHKENSLRLIYNVTPEDDLSLIEIENRLNQLYGELNKKKESIPLEAVSKDKNFKSNYEKEEYYELVKRAKDYIKSGDILQVVLSQRFSIETKSEPFQIYRKLRYINPSPYMFYIDFEEFNLIGASPENLVSQLNGTVITNPIAGTRRRGEMELEDKELEESLLNDEKEISEHTMLVDTGKMDIGRGSEEGSVKVDKLMQVERYSHVMHLVSQVSGRVKEGIDCIDTLKACFPAGTVSGAPKIRAMEIIAELENVRREFYAGTVGYMSFNGNMDMAISIRTILYKDGYAYISAGGGIVQGSTPEFEYVETVNKAKATMEVI